MAGPWEQYQTQEAEGPWSKFGGAQTEDEAPPAPQPVATETTDEDEPESGIGDYARQFAGYIGGDIKDAAESSWNMLKEDFEASHAKPEPGVWNKIKGNFDSLIATGKLPFDAFNVVISPITGATNALVSKPLSAATGGILKPDDVNTALMAARPGRVPGRPTSYAKPPTTAELREGSEAASVASADAGRSDIVLPNAGDAAAAATDMATRATKGQAIDDAIRRAKLASRGANGAGFDQAMRNEFRKLAVNPKTFGQFSPTEQQAIESVVNGGLVRNALGLLGQLSSTAGVLEKTLTLPITAGARFGANRLAGRAANNVGDMVRSGDLGNNARTYADYAADMKRFNDQISDLSAKNGGWLPARGTKLYPEYQALKRQRDEAASHMRAMPRK